MILNKTVYLFFWRSHWYKKIIPCKRMNFENGAKVESLTFL